MKSNPDRVADKNDNEKPAPAQVKLEQPEPLLTTADSETKHHYLSVQCRASDASFNELPTLAPPRRRPAPPKEYKLVALRDCPVDNSLCDTTERIADYWRAHIPNHPYFNPDVECLTAILLTTRRRVKGHYLIATGTLDTLLVHPREVFRLAIVAAAAAIVVAHNHPSGDTTPSEADIEVTRDLILAGQLLKVELLDHLIMGQSSAERPRDFASLRECGYFYS